MTNDINPEYYKKFYEENRVKVMQYESLRTNFTKLHQDVLGRQYYNMGMDVYECDRITCEDLAVKFNSPWLTIVDRIDKKIKKFIKNVKKVLTDLV